MSLTKIGSIGINTGIQLAGVTTVSTLHVGSGVTLSSDGEIFATGVSTFSGNVSVNGLVASGSIEGGADLIIIDSIVHAGDTNTKIRFPLDDTVTVETGGTQRLRIEPAGNVNIPQNVNVSGVVTATSGLTVNGDATFTGSSANIVFDQSTDDIVFNDNAKAVFGTGLDLEIFHDGSNSYIKDTGTGSLLVRGSTISLQSASGEAMIEGVADGAVTIKHDNSTKFETSSTGVSITGNATISGAINTSDNQNINVGNGGDLKIFHDGTDSFIHGTTSTRQLKIRGQEIRCVNEANSEIMAKFIEDGAVELYYDANKKLETHAQGAAIGQVSIIPTMDSFSCQILAGNSGFIGNYHSGSNQQLIIGLNQYYHGGYKAPDDNVSQHLQLYNKKFNFLTAPAPGSDNGAVTNTNILTIDEDGVKFGTDSAEANALDDYEEGTFTVTLANSLTVSQQTTLSYTKIGNKVHISGQFKVSSGGSDLIVSNLPFTTKNTGSTDETFSSGICGLYNVTFPTDGSASGEILTKTQKNDTNLYFVYNRTGNDPNQHTATTNGYYTVSHWYTAA